MKIPGVNEHKERNYLIYTYDDESIFYEAGYKALRTSQDFGFIRCNNMKFNGKIRLIYNIDKLYSLNTVIDSFSPNAFANLILSILDRVMELKKNSFIHIETVDFEPDNLYVDITELKPYFIYIPINIHSTAESFYALVEYLRKTIAYLIQSNPNLHGDLLRQISMELENYRISFEDLRGNISRLLGLYDDQGGRQKNEILTEDKAWMKNNHPAESYTVSKSSGKRINFKHEKKKKQEVLIQETSILMDDFIPRIALVSIDKTQNIELAVNKKEYVIGHSRDMSDGFIGFNSSISRKHCKIVNINGRSYIVDLSSANGTWVNGKRIRPDQNIEITPGDKIKLANSEFLVTSISGGLNK